MAWKSKLATPLETERTKEKEKSKVQGGWGNIAAEHRLGKKMMLRC
jgi:hypothetical protein